LLLLGSFIYFLLSRIFCFYCACFCDKKVWMVHWRCWSLVVGIHSCVKKCTEMELLRLLALICPLLRSRRCRNGWKLRDIKVCFSFVVVYAIITLNSSSFNYTICC
jgi:hypothetical protein